MSKKRRKLTDDELGALEAIRDSHRRRPQLRQVVSGSITFHAISAHELLDMDDLTRQGRPGLPY